MLTEEFDGQVKHKSPVPGDSSWRDGTWVDEWWGPGGHLVITNLDPTSHARVLGVDALETLYRLDGTTVQHALSEGDDYNTLEELFGPELWELRNA